MLNNEEFVILVDTDDKEMGTMEKMKAHYEGALHRAFSVFLFDFDGRVLLQRRALTKYHSGGLWTNACCSHPRQGETTEAAVHRRLMEELGVDCAVSEVHQFLYRAKLDKDMIEHELDHVFTGKFDSDEIPFNPSEVDSIRWMYFDDLKKDITENPENYTVWFQIIMKNITKEMLLLKKS